MMQHLSSTPPHRFAPDQSQRPCFPARQELTAREYQVWMLLAAGHSDAEVAQHLALNNLTVRFHMDSVLIKLGLSDRRAATTLAEQRGLLADTARS